MASRAITLNAQPAHCGFSVLGFEAAAPSPAIALRRQTWDRLPLGRRWVDVGCLAARRSHRTDGTGLSNRSHLPTIGNHDLQEVVASDSNLDASIFAQDTGCAQRIALANHHRQRMVD